MVLATIVRALAMRNQELEKDLRIAKISKPITEFLASAIKASLGISVALVLTAFLFMHALVPGVNPFFYLILFLVFFSLSYSYFKRTPKVYIRKRQRDIEREVLFAGRYLLVKIESGLPLVNSLEDASRSYGIASKYFMEIVDDIKTGTPVEEALERARELSPSKYFKMILSELITSLKTGVDISVPLRSILMQITKEQMLEIKDYGKRLNAFIMIYMVVATVLPSLGMTIFIIIASFLNLPFTNTLAFTFLFIFAFVQYLFISALHSIRPLVNF